MRAFVVEVDGGRLSGAQRLGEGAPLVLVHGFGGSRHDWDRVIAALPPSLPVIVYDQRGFGASTNDSTVPYSHAEDLTTLLRALDLRDVMLCGISLGGATVLGAALSASDRVSSAVLVSPMLAGWAWSRDWIDRWKAIGGAARSGDMTEARRLWFDHPLFATTRAGGRGEDLRASIAAFAGQQWIADLQHPAPPMVEALGRVGIPTLLLTGAHDLPDFRQMADLIEATVPNVQRIDDPDAGHLLTLETPERIAAAIMAFRKG